MKKARAPSSTGDDEPIFGTEPRRSKQELRKQAEAILAQSPGIPESLSPEEIRKRLHELRVHQIELEMQNEELRKTQTEIEAGRTRYFELYDLAPIGYCTLSEEGFILEANLTAATLLGTARSALVKHPISRFIVKEDQDIYYEHRKKLFASHSTSSGQTGEAQECELRLVKPDGTVFWAHLMATIAQAKDGAPVCRVVLSDISERKKEEELLQNSEARYSGLLANIEAGVVVHAPDTSIIMHNSRATELLGLSDEQMKGKLAIDPGWHFINENGKPYLIEEYPVNKIISQRQAIRDLVLGIVRPASNDLVWVSVNGIPVLDLKGEIFEIVISFVDITERKKAEQSSAETETRFKALHNASFGGIAIHDQGIILECNQGLSEISGYQYSELIGMDGLLLIAERSREAVLNNIRTAYEKPYEAFGLRKNGEEFDLRLEARNVPYKGKQVRTVEFRDITERKQAEDKLRASEALKNKLISNIRDVIVIIDQNGINQYKSPNVTKLFGWNPEELVGKNTWENVHPDDLEAGQQFFGTILAEHNATGTTELRFMRKDGIYVWIEVSVINLLHDKDIKGILGNYHEITERKSIEVYREMGFEILQVLNESNDIKESIQRILAVLKTQTGGDAVGMRLQEGEDFPYFVQDGFSEDFLLTENTLIQRRKDGGVCLDKDGNVSLQCTCGLVISGKTDPSNSLFTKGGSCWTNDSFPLLYLPSDQDPRLHPRNNCIHQGYASVALIPIRSTDRIVGLIQLNDKRKGRFSLEMIEILESIAANIGSALMRKRAEEALQRKQHDLSESQRIAHVGTWRLDIASNQVVWTEELYKMYEFDPSLPPPPYTEHRKMFTPESWERLSTSLSRTMETGVPYTLELETVRKDGSNGWMWVHGEADLDSAGKTLALWGVAQDITERKRAEESLRETTIQLQESIRAANVGLWDWNLATNRVHYSHEWKQQIGYDDSEIADAFEEWESRVHPEDLAPTLEKVRKAITGDSQRYQADFRFRHKNSSYRWIVAQCSVLRDETGKAVRVVGSHVDLTEYKQTEEALKHEHECLQFVVDGSRLGTWVWNVQTNETIFNETWADMLGYTLGELMPCNYDTWASLLHPDDLSTAAERLRHCADGEMTEYECEFRMRHKNGHWVWILDRGHIMTCDIDGKPLSMFGTHTDITQIKEATEALRESEARFRSYVEHAPYGVFVTDGQGRYVDVNPAAERISGYSAPQLTSMSLLDLLTAESREAGLRHFQTLVETGKSVQDLAFRHADGSLRYWSVSATFLRPDRYLGFVEDITEYKRAEEEHQQLQLRLMQAQKMESVGRLAGGVAHDFNNMLTIIIGHADMSLKRIGPNQPFYADLMEIRKAGERSANLTRQLLAFARKQTMFPKVIDLNQTVDGMLKMLQRLIGEDIDMTWIPGENLWQVKIDPGQIDQILVNLCVNARDAIAGVGKMTIETGNTAFDDRYCKDHPDFMPGEYVMLSVSDNGSGMDSETLSHLFEPFFTTKEMGKGTGLGLATVYGVVKQNNAFINVYSEPAMGTTFKIYLPRHLPKTAPLLEKEPDKPNKGHETVLLVEDEPPILKMTTTLLKQEGYTVLPAGTPGEAVRLANEHAGEIHLLMTDVVMPEMNGRDLAKNILSIYPHLKCLFMSGYTADVIAHHGVLDEGINFIQKPFSMDGLAVKLRKVLDQDQGK